MKKVGPTSLLGATTADSTSAFCFLDNFTRFYILANHPTSSIPILSNRNQGDPEERGQALICITVDPTGHPYSESTGSNSSRTRPSILEYVSLLPHTATRMDRRPSLNHAPFQDVYFVELLETLESPVENGRSKGGRNSSWVERIHDGVRRIHDAGGDVQVLGIW